LIAHEHDVNIYFYPDVNTRTNNRTALPLSATSIQLNISAIKLCQRCIGLFFHGHCLAGFFHLDSQPNRTNQ